MHCIFLFFFCENFSRKCLFYDQRQQQKLSVFGPEFGKLCDKNRPYSSLIQLCHQGALFQNSWVFLQFFHGDNSVSFFEPVYPVTEALFLLDRPNQFAKSRSASSSSWVHIFFGDSSLSTAR